jgi:hypothetical protein
MVSYQWTQQAPFQWTRIDMLLALLEETIRVLETLQQTVAGQGDQAQREAQTEALWQRGRLLVGALLSGVYPESSEPGWLCWRLYEFVLHVLEQRRVDSLAGALQVLRTLFEAFQAIRPEAVSLERTGAIPGLDSVGIGLGTVA